MGRHFDSVLLPRLKKVSLFVRMEGRKASFRQPGDWAVRSIIKVVRLESYEDALNNLETRRTDNAANPARLRGGTRRRRLKEQYMLRYMLDVETRGSQSLLNVQAFTDPTAYKLKVKRPGATKVARSMSICWRPSTGWSASRSSTSPHRRASPPNSNATARSGCGSKARLSRTPPARGGSAGEGQRQTVAKH